MKYILKHSIVFVITLEARLVLWKYKPKIIAVTGSVGKTSTKDAIYTVLRQFYFIRKSTKSFNSEIGVPLTILGCANAWNSPSGWMKNIFEGFLLILFPNRYPEWLVLEVGVDKPGDMDHITSWLKPDVVVVTRLSKVPVHVEFFSSPEAVFKEKGKLVEAVKDDGVVILNADDEDVLSYATRTKAKKILFSVEGRGFTNPDHSSQNSLHALPRVTASHYSMLYEGGAGQEVPVGIMFSLGYGEKSVPVTVRGSLGEQHAYVSLAAISVGLSRDLDLYSLVEALASFDTPPGRMRLLQGMKHTTLIDDTYNASPIAMKSALETLDSVSGKRKIAVLGDMLELGKYSTEQHVEIGKQAARCAHLLITVGVRARYIADGAKEAGMRETKRFHFERAEQAGEYLQKILKKGDVVLVKGSQSMRMERAVEKILAEPQKAGELLVRQEKDWLAR